MMRVSSKWPNGVESGMLAPWFAAKFENLPGAPMIVSAAAIKVNEIWAVNENSHAMRFNLSCSFANRSDRALSSYQFEINNPGSLSGPIGSRSGMEAIIEPRSAWVMPQAYSMSINVGKDIAEAPGNFRIRVLGAGFEDGSYWTSDSAGIFAGMRGTFAKVQPDTGSWQSFFSRLTNPFSKKKAPATDPSLVWASTDEATFQAKDDLPDVQDLVDKSEVTSLPRVRREMNFGSTPGFTPEARKNRTQGTVILSAVFRSNGNVGGIKVLQNLPDGLTEQAIITAKNLAFEPARKDGRAVSVRTNLEYQFSLDSREPREIIQLADPSTRTPYDMPPMITYQEKAEYTPQARVNRVTGVVQLSAVFGADGRLRDVKVVNGLPDGLNEQAIKAAKKVRFRPGRKGHQDADYNGTIEYQFSLE